MRIHSTSLTLIPAAINKQQSGQQSVAQNQDEAPGAPSSTDFHDSQNSSVTPATFKTIKPTAGITQSNIKIMEPAPPQNSKVLKALNAYNQVFNKPLLDQRASLINGIDTFA